MTRFQVEGVEGPRQILTESYRDLQQSYRTYNKVTELETPTLQVLSRPYNLGTYGRGAGMARRPLTV